MKRSLILMAATMAFLTGAIRINEDKDDAESAATEPSTKKSKKSQSTGNVYDDYKPFLLKDENDEMPFIHQFRHAAALERALSSNATSSQEKDIYTYLKEKEKQFNGDWKNVEGPGTYDNDAVIYDSSDQMPKRNRTAEKLEKEKEKKEEDKKNKALGPYPELEELHVPDSLRQELVNEAWKKENKKREEAKKKQKQKAVQIHPGDTEPVEKSEEKTEEKAEEKAEEKTEEKSEEKAQEKKEESFVQLGSSWMTMDNQLSWSEYKDDEKFPDQSEGHDVDFEFTKTHPDWGMDENVKEYFRKAQKIKYKKVEMENDIEPFVNKFTSVRRNVTKKLEGQEEYSETEYDKMKREMVANLSKPSDEEAPEKASYNISRDSKGETKVVKKVEEPKDEKKSKEDKKNDEKASSADKTKKEGEKSANKSKKDGKKDESKKEEKPAATKDAKEQVKEEAKKMAEEVKKADDEQEDAEQQ